MSVTITLTGNTTTDADLRITPQGIPVANVRVLVNERIKNADGNWDNGPVTGYDITAWRGLAERMAEFVKKGQRITVTGELVREEYRDRENNLRSASRITARSIAHDLPYVVKGASNATPSTAAEGEYDFAQNEPPADDNQ